MKESTLGASEFKAKCLQLLDDVAERGDHIIVTKRGKPVAKLVPIPGEVPILEGSWKHIGRIKGDLVNFHDDWGPDD